MSVPLNEDALNDGTVLGRHPDLVFAEMDGDVVMLSPDQADYLGLNEAASAIWNFLGEPRTVEAILAELLERFDVPADQCRREVFPFLNDLVQRSVIRVVPP